MSIKNAFFTVLDLAENHEPELKAAQQAFKQNNPRAAAMQDKMSRKEREQLIIDLLVFLGLLRNYDKCSEEAFILSCVCDFIKGKKTAFTKSEDIRTAMQKARERKY